jgi:hypothetical protein
MKMLSLFLVAVATLAASTCFASEGAVLLDLGGSASFVSGLDRKQPGLGGQLELLYGINDQTDIGVFARTDRSKSKATDDSVMATSGGISSWLTTYEGTIRPQVGGQIGMGYVEKTAFLHLAVQARALIELATHVRLFIGGTGGALIGDKTHGFASADFGAQILF